MSIGFAMVLKILWFFLSQTSSWFPMPQFLYNKLSFLSIILGSLTLGVYFPVSGSKPQTWESCIQALRKVHKARITKITSCVVYRSSSFTGLYGCHLSSPDDRPKQELSRDIQWFKVSSFGRSFFSWLGVTTDDTMVKNLSLEDVAESATEAVGAQQHSLDSLAFF